MSIWSSQQKNPGGKQAVSKKKNRIMYSKRANELIDKVKMCLLAQLRRNKPRGEVEDIVDQFFVHAKGMTAELIGKTMDAIHGEAELFHFQTEMFEVARNWKSASPG